MQSNSEILPGYFYLGHSWQAYFLFSKSLLLKDPPYELMMNENIDKMTV